jgi:putative transposase
MWIIKYCWIMRKKAGKLAERTSQGCALVVVSTMKGKRFAPTQIIKILKEHEAGTEVTELIHKYGIARNTFYIWKSKFGGMENNQIQKLKDLESENSKLKKLWLAEAVSLGKKEVWRGQSQAGGTYLQSCKTATCQASQEVYQTRSGTVGKGY